MEESAQHLQASAPFLQLPLELRNIIYDLLIEQAIVNIYRPLSGLTQWQTPTFSRAHTFDLHISTKTVRYPDLRLPSNLIYTCRQAHAEISTLICLRIPHLRLTGDFLMGVSSTAAIFDLLARRPWIASSIRTLKVLSKLNHVLPVRGSGGMNTGVLQRHPWLQDRLRIDELKVVDSGMGDCGRRRVPEGWWQVLFQVRNWSLGWLKALGVNMPAGTNVEKQDDVEGSHEHNMLPDLAKLFETFPLLERIDIESEDDNLLSSFHAPRDTAESFRALDERRGVEVNIGVTYWQIHSFCNMLYGDGAERGTIHFGNWSRKGRIALSYETEPGGDHRHRIISLCLIECGVRSEDSEDGSSAGMFWRTRVDDALGLWRKKNKLMQAAETDESITVPALGGETSTL